MTKTVYAVKVVSIDHYVVFNGDDITLFTTDISRASTYPTLESTNDKIDKTYMGLPLVAVMVEIHYIIREI